MTDGWSDVQQGLEDELKALSDSTQEAVEIKIELAAVAMLRDDKETVTRALNEVLKRDPLNQDARKLAAGCGLRVG